jgi:hypothetical protein
MAEVDVVGVSPDGDHGDLLSLMLERYMRIEDYQNC